MKNRLKTKLKFLFILFSLFYFNNLKSQQQQIYWIGVSNLSSGLTFCDGVGNNRYGSNIGFTWTDNLPSGAILNSVTIEYNIGINCGSMPTTITPTLNSNNQTSVTFNGNCNCTPTSTSFVSHSINTTNYIPNASNSYVLTGTSTVGFNNQHSSLSGNFAKVTVDYSTFSGPTPTITSFTPSSGSCNTLVTINGTNFNNGTPIVKFNGVTASHTYISATQLSATVPAAATTGVITVQTGGGIATSSSSFTQTTPTITTFSPSSGTCNSTVTINGTNFNSSSTVVRFNGIVANHTFVSATQLTATVPSGNSTGTITVQTCGASTATSSSNFTLTSPTITSFSPSSGTCNSTVTINGTNFNSSSTVVRFNGIVANHTFVSATQLTATVPSGNTTGTITVQTCGASTATSSSNFTLTTPTITSFSPSSATCNTQVTINGTNFNSSSTVVRFNGIVANHTFVSSTQLTATVPAGNTTGLITVQTCGTNTASSSSNFTLNTSTPTISSVSSSSGTRGTIITITGTNLTCPTAVSFGGTAAFSFNATSSTTITAEVGYGSSGNISVTTAGGTATLAGFIYTAPAAANSANIQGTGSTNTIANNQATIVDNGLLVSSNGTINGFTVTITDSYQSGDALAYNTSTGGALPAGISVLSFNTTTRSLVFTGSAIAADWQHILRNVTLTTTSAVCSPESRKVAFIAGDVFYNPLNGHFYKASSSQTSWTTARSNAENMSYFGKKGYLATITSQAENSFISRLLGQNSWIGCSDRFSEINTALGYTLYASSGSSVTVGGVTYTGNNNNGNAEGNWFWVTGPEKGTRIRNGNASNVGSSGSFGVGSAVTGVYQNWDGTEPNDHSASNFGDEDYGHIYSTAGAQQGLWNDFPDNQSIGSVIEFGDMPGDNTSGNINTIFTRNIYINGAPSGTITGGNVDVCSGTNSTTLTLTGLASGGTVTRWEYSLDNFLTAGVNVSSTSTSLTVTNISESRYYRAIVSASSCTGLATSSARIGVATTTAGSIVSNKSAICTGGSTELTLSGNIGSVVRWERSTSSTFASSVTSISNTTTSLTETLNTAGTYYYRAVVQQSGCGSAVNTNGYPVTVTTGTPPVGGTISSSSSCSGTNTITLTLSGHSGNITKWQFSTDGGYVWTDVANTTTTLTATNVTSNRRYRAIVSTSTQACGNESSSSGEVTVFGTTVVRWDGGTSTDWATSSNWCGGIPSAGQDILISSTASRDLSLDQNRTVGNIDFSSSDDKILLNGFNLTFSSVTNHNSTRYVRTNGTGRLTNNLNHNTQVTFPVGNSNYNPITINNKTGSSDNFSVRVSDAVLSDGTSGSSLTSPHVGVTWDINKTNANAGSGVDFTFQWLSSQERNSINTFKLNHYNTALNPDAWEFAAGTSGSVTTNGTTKTMTHTGYSGTFSPFAIGHGTTPLPIDLVKFSAIPNNNSVDLTWTTFGDNKNPFNILKSTDGVNWKSIGTQIPSDNSVHYLFTDHQPAPINYYQLSQIDNSNTLQYSDIRIVNFNSNKLVIFPNPNNGEFTIQSNHVVEFQVTDYTGKVIMEGDNSNPLIKTNLTKGIYFIKITEGDKTTFSKMIVQ